jgi:hypothetical protein
MPAKKSAKKIKDPKSTRPHMPGYGIAKGKAGMLPWKWAADRLKKSRQYWISTTRPDGSPHVMLVWGLWLDNEFCFSTGDTSRKARNLSSNPHCVICSDNAEQAVIVEGIADTVSDADFFEDFATLYEKKYAIDIRGMKSPIYRVRPRVVFGLFEKKFPKTATRWIFS